jgi:class 3 adenylate cyclase
MVIGENISKIDPPRSVKHLRDAVFDGAAVAVLQYLQDMRSFIPVPEMNLLSPLINKNVLTKADLTIIAHHYNEKLSEKNDIIANDHPFCALYRLGLLGVLTHEYENQTIQKFQHPDVLRTDRSHDVLPASPKYLIHPALDKIISDHNGINYRINFERANTIGDQLPWDDRHSEPYILKGDITRFSEIMHSPEYNRLFPIMFREWVQSSCEGLLFFEILAGDSILMIDGSPTALINAAQRLTTKLNQFKQFPQKIRFGGASGPIEFQQPKNIQPEGLALREAARLESNARPNTILLTGQFAEGAVKFGFLIQDMHLLTPEKFPNLHFQDGKFHIRKMKQIPLQ